MAYSCHAADEYRLGSFVLVFIGLALILSLFQVHPILSGLVKLGYITWFIVFVYSESPFFQDRQYHFNT